jgi:pimeloyl-ACP methyl ester carboxylesterase
MSMIPTKDGTQIYYKDRGSGQPIVFHYGLIDVPTLVMNGDDDQIVPVADSLPLSVKLLKKGTLKVCEKFPHGMWTTHKDQINADLLAFIMG